MAALFSSHSIPFSIEDLSKKDIALLTQILSLPPSSLGGTLTRRQTTGASSRLVASLPKHLLSPIPYQHKIVTFISKHVSSIPPSTLAPLCPTHASMNTQLIHSIFTCLALEVGIRLNTLTTYLYLYPQHETFIHSLREVHALWLAPGVYTKTFLEAIPAKWTYEASRCEACMLARVGGDVDMVCKLKAALTSRQRGHRKKPLLVRWVDGWLEWLNENQPFLQVAERKVKIDEETSAIREARKIAQKAKKGKKPKDFQEKNRNPFGDENRIESPKPRSHHEKSREPFEYDRRIESAKPKNHHETRRNPHDDGKRIKSPESPEPKNHHGKSRDPYDDGKRIKSPDPEEELEAPDEIPEPTGRDFENSIIDHYGALMSTTHLPTHADGSRWQFSCAPRPEDEGHVHLAFRNRPEASDRRDSTKRAAGGAGTQAKEYQALLPDRERTQTLNRRGSTRPGTNGAVVTNQEYVPPRRDWKKIETPSREGSTRSGAETTPKKYPTPSQKMEKIETPQRRGITRPATRGEVANTEEHKIRPPNGERAKSSARERATDSTTVTSWENLYNGQK